MKIMAIETSCDETAIAIVKTQGSLKSPKFKILKNLVSSQIKIHRPFGGVVPNLAKREHLKNLPIIFRKIFGSPTSKNDRNITRSDFRKIDLVTVTVGPGLEPCLWTGINFAKEIQKKYFPKAKLIGANHLEGHLYSFLLPQKANSQFSRPTSHGRSPDGRAISNFQKLFPAVALIVSGGHTILLLMKSLTNWKKLGETLDDAVGESFDKVARMLNLPYPGGPEIEKLAYRGSTSINFPRPMLIQKNYNFSFSGLKTAVLYYLRDQRGLSHEKTRSISPARKLPLVPRPRSSDAPAAVGDHARSGSDTLFLEINPADVATSFQKAAIDVLVAKTMRAAKEFNAKSIMLSGGVAANKALRKELQATSYKLKANFLAPSSQFNTDNAAMIAAAAYINFLQHKNRRLTANSNLNL